MTQPMPPQEIEIGSEQHLHVIEALFTDWRTAVANCAQSGDSCNVCHQRAEDVAEHMPDLVAEVRRLRAQIDKPCGSCHPCTNYADETWRAAGRKPPAVSAWDELRAEVKLLRQLAVDLARLLHDHEGGAVPADSLQALLARATAAV